MSGRPAANDGPGALAVRRDVGTGAQQQPAAQPRVAIRP